MKELRNARRNVRLIAPEMAGRRAASARPFARCLLAVGLLAASTGARALYDDRLTVFADETLSWDSNVTRVAGGFNPTTGTDLPRLRDWRAMTTVGVAFDVPVSRQRFQGGYAYNDARYHRLRELDYTGHEGRLLWLWQFGHDASGKIGYTDVTAPQTFANVQGRSNEVLSTKQLFANGSWFVIPRIRLDGGVNGYRQRNGSSASQVDDVDITTVEGAANYIGAPDRSTGLHVRYEDGDYPNRDTGLGLRPSGYRQTEGGMLFDWRFTGKSKLTGRIDYASRRWEGLNGNMSGGDWNGMVGRLQYDWQPTGKTFVTTMLRREVNPYEDARANFVLIKSITVIPTWHATDKIDLAGALDYSVRDYPGIPQFACGIALGSRDKVKSATLNGTYRATRTVTMHASAQHQNCASDYPGAHYTANIISLGIRVAL